MVSMAFIGHLGKHELSAAVLGTSLFNVTGLSILIGLCSAMETLCGQVHTAFSCCTPACVLQFRDFLQSCHLRQPAKLQSFGAKNYSNLGIILQRALLVTAAACVLVVTFWTQVDRLLIALGRLLNVHCETGMMS